MFHPLLLFTYPDIATFYETCPTNQQMSNLLMYANELGSAPNSCGRRLNVSRSCAHRATTHVGQSYTRNNFRLSWFRLLQPVCFYTSKVTFHGTCPTNLQICHLLLVNNELRSAPNSCGRRWKVSQSYKHSVSRHIRTYFT